MFSLLSMCLALLPALASAAPARRNLFGSAEYSDEPTTEPTLYLVGLNINDLTRTTYAFNNPNGWYCFYTSVVITAKQEVHIVEGAHLADSQSKVHVLGKGDERHSGIIVLGGIGVYDK